jgi:myosin heavy subunit
MKNNKLRKAAALLLMTTVLTGAAAVPASAAENNSHFDSETGGEIYDLGYSISDPEERIEYLNGKKEEANEAINEENAKISKLKKERQAIKDVYDELKGLIDDFNAKSDARDEAERRNKEGVPESMTAQVEEDLELADSYAEKSEQYRKKAEGYAEKLKKAEIKLERENKDWNSRKSAAQEKLDSAQKKYDSLGVSFMDSRAEDGTRSDDVKRVLAADMTEAGSDTVSGLLNAGQLDRYVNSAYSITNIRKSLDLLDECNELRAKHGASPLKFNYSLMAFAVYSNAVGKYTHDHTLFHDSAVCDITSCGAENLAWGYDDPYDGWYYQEKKLADQGVTEYKRIGHYLNTINTSIKSAAIAYSSDGRAAEWSGSRSEGDASISEVRSALSDYTAAYEKALNDARSEAKTAEAKPDAVSEAENEVKSLREKFDEYTGYQNEMDDKYSMAYKKYMKDKQDAADYSMKLMDDLQKADEEFAEAQEKVNNWTHEYGDDLDAISSRISEKDEAISNCKSEISYEKHYLEAISEEIDSCRAATGKGKDKDKNKDKSKDNGSDTADGGSDDSYTDDNSVIEIDDDEIYVGRVLISSIRKYRAHGRYRKVRISWKKAFNAGTYTVYTSTSKYGRYRKAGTTKKLSKTIRARRHRTIYVKVRAANGSIKGRSSKAKCIRL